MWIYDESLTKNPDKISCSSVDFDIKTDIEDPCEVLEWTVVVLKIASQRTHHANIKLSRLICLNQVVVGRRLTNIVRASHAI